MKLRWILTLLAAGVVALAVACGGDDDNDNASNSGGTSGGGSAVSQELNLAQAATTLQELNSFRFDLSFKLDFDLEALAASGEGDEELDEFGAEFAAAFLALFSDISMQGAYVGPDSFDMQMSIAGEDVRYVQIGSEAWVDDGSGWMASDSTELDILPFGDPTSFATDFLPDAVLRNADISEEDVGGVPAVKYHFDKAALEAVAAEMGEDFSDFGDIEEMQLDVWLVEGNLPVKFEVSLSGSDPEGGKLGMQAKFEITDINGDIQIERPIP